MIKYLQPKQRLPLSISTKKQRPKKVTAQTARVFYVDGTSGSDANDGLSEAKAFKTVSKAIGESSAPIAPGDRVRIKAGLYRERITVKKSGTPTARITVEAFGDGQVILDGSNLVTGWTQQSGEVYVASVAAGVKAVVVDDKPLYLETSQVGVISEGRYFYDALAGKLYVWAWGGGSPATHDIGVIKDDEYQNVLYLNPSNDFRKCCCKFRFNIKE